MSKPKPKFPLSKIVEVEWVDACGQAGWRDIAVYNDLIPAACKTAGYLLKRSKNEIILSLTQNDQHDLNQCICIPASWIVKVRKLKY